MDPKDLIINELDDHLHNGCVDHRCDFNADEVAFPEAFLAHLAESIMDVLSAES